MSALTATQLQAVLDHPSYALLPVQTAAGNACETWQQNIETVKQLAIDQAIWAMSKGCETVLAAYPGVVQSLKIDWDDLDDGRDWMQPNVKINGSHYSSKRYSFLLSSYNVPIQHEISRMTAIDECQAIDLLFHAAHAAIPESLHDQARIAQEAFGSPITYVQEARSIAAHRVHPAMRSQLEALALEVCATTPSISSSRPRI